MPTLEEIKQKVIEVWESDHIVLPSVTAAQFMLESASGASSLAKASNNLFGIKASSPWTGDTHTIVSNEEINGVMKPKESIFRKYATWEDSVQDHSDFFVSTETRKKVYAGIIGETDYKKACNAMTGSYATDSSYGKKLIAIIEANGLAQWDVLGEVKAVSYVINDRRASALGGQSKDRNRSAITTIGWHYSAVMRSVRKFITGHEAYWRDSLGWDRGGYHFYIDADGNIWQNYDYERITWGVYNNNGYVVHISVEAGNGNDYSPAQVAAREWLTRKIMSDLNIPASEVKGHNEIYNNSSCPGYTKAQMDAFRAKLAQPTQAAAPEPVIQTRVPVSYDATVISGGYSIDSKPWGEDAMINWGTTDAHVGKKFYFYEENETGEYANAKGVGWIDKRAIEKDQVVVASLLHLPNGQNWTTYPPEGPYTAGDVISLEGPNGECVYTILGERNGGKVLIVELENFGVVGLYFDADKKAKITQVLG